MPPGVEMKSQRGFTLVELMVALVGGLFVSLAVFSVAKQSSNFSASQSRVSDATLQTMLGFERLQADLGRAGFQTTPNIARDLKFCGRLDATFPAWLRRMASVYIENTPAAGLSTEITQNGIQPREITLTGNYTAGCMFETRNIDELSSPTQIILKPDSFCMVKSGFDGGGTSLARIFRPGRALRIVDKKGKFQFGVIASTSIDPPTITLTPAPAIQFSNGSSNDQCGPGGNGTGGMVNPVNIIRYRIGSLRNDPRFAAMYGPLPFSEATRMELIREELNVFGVPFANSQELVSEYAVDLDFALLVEQPGTNALATVDAIDPQFAGNVPTTTGGSVTPQRIRAIHAWLSVRTREAEFPADLTIPLASPGPSLVRINLRSTAESLPPVFAHVRSLRTSVSLSNQDGATWQ